MSHDPELDQDHKRRHLLAQVLRDLPHRPAPATLESRVFGELRRRAAQPWWQRSFAHWPLPARTVFVAVCVSSSALVLMGGSLTEASMGTVAHEVTGLLSPAIALGGVPLRAIPPAWLNSALTAAAVLYATLFGLGALAYRTLYLNSPGREPS